ncbi:hypothetical protein [Pseudaeromonas paramecii]|uniref:Photosystem I assembly protein Ycf4 n=1 Tax=Pseudaeromonas paramecii TaxID=2138166 RepID=A0ABP8Q3N4_9GAMM
MNDKVIYESKNYKLTPTSFTYQGYTEPLKNIADLFVVENGRKEKIIAGLTLSVWGVFFSFAVGNVIALFILAPSMGEAGSLTISDIQTLSLLLFFSVFFVIGYVMRAKYRLFIVKSNGSKGSIDKNRTSREEFDKLISAVKQAICEHC